MKKNKAVRFIHLWLGMISGLVVFTVAVTGCIYAFEEEIRSVIHKDLQQVPAQLTGRYSLDSLITKVREEHKEIKIKNIRVFSDPGRSIIFNTRNNTSIFLDPYTGSILGTLDTEKEFLAVILKIHRSLYLGDPGKMITGASALIFFVMLISGIILWWPGKKKNLKSKFRFSLKTSRKRLIYDLHSILGFYASWIIIFTVITGLIWSYKWMEGAMYAVTGSVKETVKLKSVKPGSAADASVEKILAISLSSSAGSSEQLIMLPEDSTGVIKVNARHPKSGFFTKNDQYYFNRFTAEKLKEVPFEKSSAGDKLKATNLQIHTGKVFGLPGQLMVFFASLICASLPITGFMFWWGKRKEKD